MEMRMSSELDDAKRQLEIAHAVSSALGQLISDMLIGYALKSSRRGQALEEARTALDQNIEKFAIQGTDPNGAPVDASRVFRAEIKGYLDKAEDFARYKLKLPARS
jgi:hypothetical protein